MIGAQSVGIKGILVRIDNQYKYRYYSKNLNDIWEHINQFEGEQSNESL